MATTETASPTAVTGSTPASGRGVGLAIALSSAASFALSGSFGHALLDLGAAWVLVKGGHAAGDPTDVLVGRGEPDRTFTARRDANAHTHGTGCTLASALASRLALGDDVPTATAAAKAYVTGAIAAGFALGGGIGPTDHLWRLRQRLA